MKETVVDFMTTSLVEAALMWLRVGEVTCKWNDRRMCEFHFVGTEADVKFATNLSSKVPARDFNHALVTVKAAMYSSKDG